MDIPACDLQSFNFLKQPPDDILGCLLYFQAEGAAGFKVAAFDVKGCPAAWVSPSTRYFAGFSRAITHRNRCPERALGLIRLRTPVEEGTDGRCGQSGAPGIQLGFIGCQGFIKRQCVDTGYELFGLGTGHRTS